MAKAAKAGYQAETLIHSYKLISTEAILIRTTRLTDTSLIVHWYSEDEGLLKTVAKGALRPKSAFSGKLDLFFSGEIAFVQARTGELHSLREVSISHWRQGLQRQYLTTLMAGYFCQLLESAVEPMHGDPPLFDLLKRGLDYLDDSEPTLKALFHFEKQLAKLLGILPEKASPEFSLKAHLGSFPSSRKQLLDRLAGI